ncbi:hypothetical protein PYW08_003627 [Mythimna loreyi]|uniref:Uncharacterized protein n=1 Tax=Mythimna loreyi TaxID=667449 RepID=A0ACC2QTR5_9NEOP|nr:hypothetical protein PYW08_003627 [Mythimna loreyi]
MLKSHLKINYDDEQEEEEPDEYTVVPKPKEEKPEKKKRTHRKRAEGDNVPNNVEESEEEEEEEVEPVKKEEIPPRQLYKSEIGDRCSMLGKTAEGDGYTYLKCTLTGMKMTNIRAIRRYRHLMFLDVSNNCLDLDALQVIAELPYLILIHADNNKLTSAAIKPMKYLQCIILNNNQITSVHDVFQEELSTLELGFNQIETVAFDNRMHKIKVLDFRNNLIADISNFNFPLLDSLYLGGNKLTTLVGLEKLTNLRILHVRNNPIKLLNGFDEALTKLIYINLRNCKVGTMIQIKKLRVLKGIETLVLKGCPVMGGTGEEETEVKGEEDDPQLRVEILAALPRLKRLNKYIVTDEEREEAKTLMQQWIDEGENDEEEIEPEEIMGEEEQRQTDEL